MFDNYFQEKFLYYSDIFITTYTIKYKIKKKKMNGTLNHFFFRFFSFFPLTKIIKLLFINKTDKNPISFYRFIISSYTMLQTTQCVISGISVIC